MRSAFVLNGPHGVLYFRSTWPSVSLQHTRYPWWTLQTSLSTVLNSYGEDFWISSELEEYLLLFSCPVVSDSLRPHRLQHARPPCPSPFSKVCPSSCPLHRWCHPAISSSDTLFSFCPLSFPATGTCPISWLFISGKQNTGASTSASVLPTSIQGWSPLRLTDLISLLFKGLSGVFSSTMIQRHQFFGTLPSLQSSSHNHRWPLERP